jgi:hypothetical protein
MPINQTSDDPRKAHQLVVDASMAGRGAVTARAVAAAATTPVGFAHFRQFELVAPPLMWIEAVSTLHAAS